MKKCFSKSVIDRERAVLIARKLIVANINYTYESHLYGCKFTVDIKHKGRLNFIIHRLCAVQDEEVIENDF